MSLGWTRVPPGAASLAHGSSGAAGRVPAAAQLAAAPPGTPPKPWVPRSGQSRRRPPACGSPGPAEPERCAGDRPVRRPAPAFGPAQLPAWAGWGCHGPPAAPARGPEQCVRGAFASAWPRSLSAPCAFLGGHHYQWTGSAFPSAQSRLVSCLAISGVPFILKSVQLDKPCVTSLPRSCWLGSHEPLFERGTACVTSDEDAEAKRDLAGGDRAGMDSLWPG